MSIVVVAASQLLEEIPADIQPILSKIMTGSKSRKIAKASDSLEVEGHKAIAKVIKHNDAGSRFARTVIIQNSPEAYQAFGVRNAPRNISGHLQNERETHGDTSEDLGSHERQEERTKKILKNKAMSVETELSASVKSEIKSNGKKLTLASGQ